MKKMIKRTQLYSPTFQRICVRPGVPVKPFSSKKAALEYALEKLPAGAQVTLRDVYELAEVEETALPEE